MGCAQYSKIITPLDQKLFTKTTMPVGKEIITKAANMQIPDHLNEQFFAAALESGLYETQPLKLHEIRFEYGSAPGENFCSSIYRVLIRYERSAQEEGPKNPIEHLSVIIKTIPVSNEFQFLEDLGVFMKERYTYEQVLPRLDILCKREKFGANCLYSVKAPLQTIVFSDLKAEGFRLADRIDGLDWHHTSLVLQQLAKFHASSMVLLQKMPKAKRHYHQGLVCKDTVFKSPNFQQMFGGFLAVLTKATATWPGFETITGHLQRFLNNFGVLSVRIGEPKLDDRYIVLNHGDMWINNVMFAYDDEHKRKKPTRQIFVDFQLSFFGSPGCDINFFLSTSVALNVLKEHRSELIHNYYNTFVQTLQYLRYTEIPTFEDLEHEIRSRELYGFFGLFGFLPFIKMPKNASTDNSIESFSNAEEKKQKQLEALFAEPGTKALYEYGLKRLEEIGAFREF